MAGRDSTQGRSPGSGKARSSARARGRPTIASAAALWEGFLHHALEEFLAKGYAGASIEGIARASGVSRVTIYKQFGTKHKLFRAVTLRAMERTRVSIDAATDLTRAPQEVLLEIAHRVYAESTSRLTLALTRVVVAEAERFPDVAARVYADIEIVMAPLIEYLRFLSTKGVIVAADPLELAIMLTSLVVGGVRSLMEPPLAGPALDQWLRTVLQVFLKGVAVRPD